MQKFVFCMMRRKEGKSKRYRSNPRYSISPPSSCTAGRIRVSNNSLIIATISESSYKCPTFRRASSQNLISDPNCKFELPKHQIVLNSYQESSFRRL